MIKTLTNLKPELTRCAVCKIDLKGKFVFIDDKVEKLLGFSKEELFGKSFLDYLDQPSQQLLIDILHERNNYETFFDSTTLNILNNQQVPIHSKVVVSMNFIAGNPVNFQLIIDADPTQAKYPVTQSNDNMVLSVLDKIDEQTLCDYNSLLSLLFTISKAESTALYAVTEEVLELIASHSLEDAIDPDLKTLTQTTQLHLDYALSQQQYSSLDDISVASAIEKYKNAPNEFFFPIKLIADQIHYLRFIYPEDCNHKKLGKVSKKLSVACKTMEKMYALKSSFSESEDFEVNVKFTIGFLDTLKVPAFLTDSEGVVVGYNPSMKQIFDEESLQGSYFSLIQKLKEYNKSLSIDEIVDYVNSPYDESEQGEKHIIINIDKKTKRRLTILKIGDREIDRSACFAFVPVSE